MSSFRPSAHMFDWFVLLSRSWNYFKVLRATNKMTCASSEDCALMVAKSARFFIRTEQMPRLICVSSAHTSFCWFCHAAAHILDEVPTQSMMCFSSFYHKIMFNAVKNAKAILISYFHNYVYIKQIRRVL